MKWSQKRTCKNCFFSELSNSYGESIGTNCGVRIFYDNSGSSLKESGIPIEKCFKPMTMADASDYYNGLNITAARNLKISRINNE